MKDFKTNDKRKIPAFITF